MPPLSYSGYRFPRDIIQRAVWMDLRFSLSFRDVEELLAERGIVVTYESIRRWVLIFGPAIARRLRMQRPKPHGRWHLDEMVGRIGKQMYLWRAVGAEGEVLDVLLQAKQDKRAAQKLMRKLLKRQGMAPDEWVTDKNPAYGAALRTLKLTRAAHTRRKRANNRAESSQGLSGIRCKGGWTCSGTVESFFGEGGGFRCQTRRRASPLRSAPRPCGLPRPAGAADGRWPPVSGWGGPRCGTGSTAAIGRGSRRLLTVRRTGRPS